MHVPSSVRGQKTRVLSKPVNQPFVSWEHLMVSVTNFSPGTGMWEEKYVFQYEEVVNGTDYYHKQPV